MRKVLGVLARGIDKDGKRGAREGVGKAGEMGLFGTDRKKRNLRRLIDLSTWHTLSLTSATVGYGSTPWAGASNGQH